MDDHREEPGSSGDTGDWVMGGRAGPTQGRGGRGGAGWGQGSGGVGRVGAGQWRRLDSKSCGSFCPEGPTSLPEAPRLYGGTRVDAGGAAWETRGQIQEQVGGSCEEKGPGDVHAAKVWAKVWGPCETGKDCWGRALDLLNASQVK